MTRDPITQKKDSIQRYFNAISMVFDWYFHGISMVFTSYSTNLLGVSWGCSGGISDWMYVYIYSYMMLYVQPYYMTIGIVLMLITMGMPSYNPNCKKLFWNVLDGWFLQDLDISPGT